MNMILQEKLIKRKSQGHERHLTIAKDLVDFASNDYLGLARSDELYRQVLVEWEQSKGGLHGSTGSRLLTGNTAYAEQLEEVISAFHGYASGLLFSCGYMANLGLITAVAAQNDRILFDAHIHASTLDGIKLSQARAFPFRHNDLDHLESRLKKQYPRGSCYVCIESVYSTDGSQAPLRELCQLTQKYGAYLIVDEAHAVGVLGPQGRGLIAEQKVTNEVFAQVVTFGKALGVHGAIVLGSRLLKQTLINFARPCIYTTALPFSCLAAIRSSYALFPMLEKERIKLSALIGRFRAAMGSSSTTTIQAIPMKGNERVREGAKQIARQGYHVSPLMSPTVQQGEEVLRICLHAFNTDQEVDHLLQIIKALSIT